MNKHNFSPFIWPEDPVPDNIAGCKKCELSAQRSRIIWGEGNPRARVIVILDNPGAREDKAGNSFVCGSRQTLQQGAFEAGFTMEDLYVTYILKCRPTRRYDKDIARTTCLSYLENQLQCQNAQIAFCMGNTATQWFFNDMTAEVKNLRQRWHQVRNLTTAVTYHPLAVRRRPNLYPVFLEDWQFIATLTKTTQPR